MHMEGSDSLLDLFRVMGVSDIFPQIIDPIMGESELFLQIMGGLDPFPQKMEGSDPLPQVKEDWTLLEDQF